MKVGSSGDEWLFHTTHFITLDQPFFLQYSVAYWCWQHPGVIHQSHIDCFP
jgi:hypothetical protein